MPCCATVTRATVTRATCQQPQSYTHIQRVAKNRPQHKSAVEKIETHFLSLQCHNYSQVSRNALSSILS